MDYLKKEQLGKNLQLLLDSNRTPSEIASWAFDIHLAYDNTSEIDAILKKLHYMDAGPEFEYSTEELYAIAKDLIDKGNEEELSKPINSIKHIAIKLSKDWLMCPLCQEAWESKSTLGMVRCPNCMEKLHNPNYNN